MTHIHKIYLDNNATTPIAREVVDTVIEAMGYFGNPSSLHSFGREARGLLLQARDDVAKALGVGSREILFTASATEALNTLLKSIPQGHIITSSLEHPAVYNTVQWLETRGAKITYLPGSRFGAPTLAEVEAAILPETRLITLMAVNNETGVMTDIEGISQLAFKRGIPFVIDGVGLLGKEPFQIPQGVSAMVFSGHKIHGPKGVAVVFIRKNYPFQPLILGGEQESGKRGGTEDLPAICGMAAAMKLAESTLSETIARMRELRDRFEEALFLLGDVYVNGEGPRVSNTSNLAFLGVEGEVLLRELDMSGVAASHGSACTSGSIEPSRPLLNMGYEKERVNSSIRFSLSRYTTAEEIAMAVERITKAVRRLRG